MAKEVGDKPNRLAQVKTMISAKKVAFQQLLPAHVSLDKMLRLAFTAYQNPKLSDCDPNSLISAMIDSCRLGLEPDGVEGAFVPYDGQIQFQPMYRGLISLARRSGEVTSIQAFVVYERDKYRVVLGSDPHIEHEMFTEGDRGKPIFVYSVIGLRGGEKQFDVMTISDVNRIRDRSKAYKKNPQSTPWGTDPDEMAKKTITKRNLKYAPRSVELQRALDHDNALDHDEDPRPAALGWDDVDENGQRKVIDAPQTKPALPDKKPDPLSAPAKTQSAPAPAERKETAIEKAERIDRERLAAEDKAAVEADSKRGPGNDSDEL